jgi:hypothetical protein
LEDAAAEGVFARLTVPRSLDADAGAGTRNELLLFARDAATPNITHERSVPWQTKLLRQLSPCTNPK